VEKVLVKNLLSRLLFDKDAFGLDKNDPNLIGTPERLIKMYMNEFFLNVNKEPLEITTFPNEGFDEMILLDNINFTSLCSHHFLPFFGRGWLIYVADKSIVGASKPSRILDFFARKPQLQEKLCTEVMNHFVTTVQPKGAMLVLRATHQCMTCRGIKAEPLSGMTTSAIYGCFKDQTVRSEGLDLIKISIMDRR
jgi:GTP cyclohydrolase I